MRQERAPVALLEPQAPKISPRYQQLRQQLPRGKRNRLPIADFLQHDGIAAALQADKNLFKENHLFSEVSP
jgi:hypothetical protein